MKRKVVLSDRFKEDLIEVYMYGIEVFGKAQTRKFYDEILTAMETIAQFPLI